MTKKLGTPNIDKILSEKDFQHHQDIIKARKDIMDANTRLDTLTKDCDHKLLPLTPNQINLLREGGIDSWDYSDAKCMICDKFFGWRCSDSPDGVCHYYSTQTDRDGVGPYFVKLINGKIYQLDDDYDYSKKVNETSDSCIFCHKPDERL